ncbi:MAG: hypothetical protein H7099_14630 [Gemmatimonadaceae bacterium]|nr:hypothetical protein [Gemmatimonadaceae bacterium]
MTKRERGFYATCALFIALNAFHPTSLPAKVLGVLLAAVLVWDYVNVCKAIDGRPQ